MIKVQQRDMVLTAEAMQKQNGTTAIPDIQTAAVKSAVSDSLFFERVPKAEQIMSAAKTPDSDEKGDIKAFLIFSNSFSNTLLAERPPL